MEWTQLWELLVKKLTCQKRPREYCYTSSCHEKISHYPTKLEKCLTPDPLPKAPLKSLKLGFQALLQSLAEKILGLRQTPLGLEEHCQIVEAAQSLWVVFAQSCLPWARQDGWIAQIASAHPRRNWKPTVAIKRIESHKLVMNRFYRPLLTLSPSKQSASNKHQIEIKATLEFFKAFAMSCFGMDAALGTLGQKINMSKTSRDYCYTNSCHEKISHYPTKTPKRSDSRPTTQSPIEIRALAPRRARVLAGGPYRRLQSGPAPAADHTRVALCPESRSPTEATIGLTRANIGPTWVNPRRT